MMSSLSSSPIENRTTSGPAPASIFCASRELAMGSGCRMNDKRARIADIGEMREELHVGNELDARVVATLEPECKDRACPFRARICLASLE